MERVGVTEDGVEVRFTVADTGVGIDPGARARLFQAFSQADTSTTRRYSDTGLGLATCGRFVEPLGGRIEVDRTPGTGSTFWFTMPLRPGQEPTTRCCAGTGLGVARPG